MATGKIPGAARALALALAAALLPAAARALCTSDGVAQPALLLERFISADCAECWTAPSTPDAAAGTLALDWVLPGRRGDDAPLSAVAIDDALQRLAYLKQPAPDTAAAVSRRREGKPPGLRVAQGQAFNDYVAASVELKGPAGAAGSAWLLLVESLPAGTEGSPVARNLVRNVFRTDWAQPVQRLADTRAMQVHQGAQAGRLRLVAVLHDGQGRLRGLTRSECRE